MAHEGRGHLESLPISDTDQRNCGFYRLQPAASISYFVSLHLRMVTENLQSKAKLIICADSFGHELGKHEASVRDCQSTHSMKNEQ